MTPILWLQAAESRGFAFAARGGRLVVSPASRLTPEDQAYLRANRDALLELAEGREQMRATFGAVLGVPDDGRRMRGRYIELDRGRHDG